MSFQLNPIKSIIQVSFLERQAQSHPMVSNNEAGSHEIFFSFFKSSFHMDTVWYNYPLSTSSSLEPASRKAPRFCPVSKNNFLFSLHGLLICLSSVYWGYTHKFIVYLCIYIYAHICSYYFNIHNNFSSYSLPVSLIYFYLRITL